MHRIPELQSDMHDMKQNYRELVREVDKKAGTGTKVVAWGSLTGLVLLTAGAATAFGLQIRRNKILEAEDVAMHERVTKIAKAVKFNRDELDEVIDSLNCVIKKSGIACKKVKGCDCGCCDEEPIVTTSLTKKAAAVAATAE